MSTLYGQVLIAKSALALLMIGLGGINFMFITPRMRRGAARPAGDPPLVAIFRRIVTSEILMGVILFLIVGLLTAAPPAQVANAAPSIQQSAKADDLSISLKIEPGKVGLNVFSVMVTSGGQPVDGARQVQLKFTPSSNLAPSTLDLPGRGGGQYIAKAANLSQAANWQIQVAVRRPQKFDSFANFNVNLGGGAAPSTFPWGRVAGALMLLGGFGLVFVTNRLGLSRTFRTLAGAVPALALAAAGAWTIYRPPEPPQASLANPIAPNEQSVASGKALYQTNCVPCHGVSGKGDGPVGLTLNPRPADLTYHATPGVHSDGQLWGWITNGYPGSAMPAFKSRSVGQRSLEFGQLHSHIGAGSSVRVGMVRLAAVVLVLFLASCGGSVPLTVSPPPSLAAGPPPTEVLSPTTAPQPSFEFDRARLDGDTVHPALQALSLGRPRCAGQHLVPDLQLR